MVWDLGFNGLGLRVYGLRVRVQVQCLGFRVWNLRSRVKALRFRVAFFFFV
jgi:hypothetical protein